MGRGTFSDKLVERFGPPRQKGTEITGEHEKMAAATQRVFEDVTAQILRGLRERTGASHLIVSGGCFMNGRVQRQGAGVDRLRGGFVSSSPDGSGTLVGAALYLHAQRTQERSLHVPDHNFWGPGYSDEECLALARRYRTPTVEVVKDPSSAAADDLVAGRIVGWFQGRMEFGQRALGNRSIRVAPTARTSSTRP